MVSDDDLVAFLDVKVIRSTAPALFCRIGERNVWLPRGHISGRLWCTGDRGKLFIRRWVARDRDLIDLAGKVVALSAPPFSPPPDLGRLQLVRGSRKPDHAR
jgi:hypothetical protein